MVPARRSTQNWLPDFFNDFFDNTWMDRAKTTAPAINVFETEKAYELELAAPGMTKEDFKIQLDEEGNLVIKMEKKVKENEKDKKGQYLRREFSYTRFQQTMLLPDDADREAISARVENGLLCVDIPKIRKVEVPENKKVIEIQ